MWLDSGNSIKVAPTGFPGVGENLSPRTERMELPSTERGKAAGEALWGRV